LLVQGLLLELTSALAADRLVLRHGRRTNLSTRAFY
jgi:hypothetical protein